MTATKMIPKPAGEPEPALYGETIADTGIDPAESSREIIADIEAAKAELRKRLGT